MSIILSTKSVSKKYGPKVAVDNVSLDIEKGLIYGLIGPNGAGKTTLIRMINQIILPDKGEILLDNRPLNSSDIGVIGYMPEERGLYPKMKIIDQIVYFARLKGVSEKVAKDLTKEWIEKFSLSSYTHKKAQNLSKGMQQKVQFICTVIHKPRILILDEPLSGLDPVSAIQINEEIQQLKKEGVTVIFSTHRMEQVEQICDKVFLINKGQKILEGGVEENKQKLKEGHIKVDFVGDASIKILNGNFQIIKVEKASIIFKLNKGQSNSQLIKFLLDNNMQIISFSEVLPSLKEIFIKLTS
ncbi:MAG: ATP-binding cassette domain-containing protein [Patescibacteria group bacterium]